MSAANVIAEAFGEGANLYSDVLALPSAGPDVSPAQLRKAYYKQALLYHPDKQHSKPRSEADEAKAKFQAVSVSARCRKTFKNMLNKDCILPPRLIEAKLK